MGVVQGNVIVRHSDSGSLEQSVDGGQTWTAVGGGTVAVDGTLTGNGTVGNPLSVVPQFGSDTLVKLPNSGATLVTSLELVTSLTANTPGAEASKWLVKLLSAGAQATAMDIRPGQVLLPDGSQAAPAYAFQNDAGMGMYRSSAAQITFGIAGTAAFQVNSSGSGVHTTGNGAYYVGTGTTEGLGFNGTSSLWVFSTTPRDIVFGSTGALATNATAGFVDLPGGAGAPTGVPVPPSGKFPMYIDSTNSKLWVNFSGTWKGIALA